MARIKDIKTKCENKLNIFKEKFRIDKTAEQSLRLPYDTTQTSLNVSITKDFCSEIKRIGSYGLVTYSINEDDKKPKKKSLAFLAGLFNDTSSKFHEKDPKRGPLKYSTIGFVDIIKFTEEFQTNMEYNVMKPLENLEKICIEIQDCEKKLHSLKREIASMIEKQIKFEEQTPQDEQKILILKEQIDVSQSEFENLTDLYIQKVMTFEASNFRYAEALEDMILLRTEYHEKCSKALMKMIPDCNTFMESNRILLSFGTCLENHLRETKRFIAYPIEYCVKALSNTDHLQQEGLFRVSGSMNKANLLCNVLNLMKWDKVDIDWPPHVVADVLKRYLREMPVSLLGKIVHAEWEACHEKYKVGNKQGSYKKIKDHLAKLPKSYYQNLEYLIRFLNLVVHEKSYNLMGISNICMVFVPNLFKSSSIESETIGGFSIENNASCNFVLESLLQDTNFFFPHSDQTDKEPRNNFMPLCIHPRSKEKGNISPDARVNSLIQNRPIAGRYLATSNSNNNESCSIPISHKRREQLKVNPLNLEELQIALESEIQVSHSSNMESRMSIPPVPPRSKVRKQ